jgi:hypothetical protein
VPSSANEGGPDGGRNGAQQNSFSTLKQLAMKEPASETQELALNYSSRIFLRLVFAECIWLLGSWYK